MDNTEPIKPTVPPEKKENKFIKRIKSFSSNFKALPIGAKRLLSLGLVVALLVALPIVVMTMVTTRTFFLNRAATGETIEPPLTPTPTPSLTPTISPKPTPTVKPSITPIPLIRPVISTTSLPEANAKKVYSANITGYEKRSNVKLNMKISGLPSGLTYTCLTGNSIGGSSTTISCSIKGSPLLDGTFKIPVSLSDNFGQSVAKTFTLVVSPF